MYGFYENIKCVGVATEDQITEVRINEDRIEGRIAEGRMHWGSNALRVE